jgi:hypothetical protein
VTGIIGERSYAEQLEYWGLTAQNYGRDHLGWNDVRMWDEGVAWDRQQRAAGKDSYRQPVLGELAKRYPDQVASEDQVRAIEDELRELVAQAGIQAETWRREAQGSPQPEPAEDTEWTVIGVWLCDEPVTTGVVAGRHDVSGGDTEQFPQGCWATSVSAPDPDTAEAEAVAEMRGDTSDD